jgi:hypothetical protein
MKHCSLRTALGFDKGELLGNNLGAQMTFLYFFKRKDEK